MEKITKDAFSHIKEQTVPLVAYAPDGTRIVIGEATVTGDAEGLKVVSTKIEDDKYKSLLEIEIDHLLKAHQDVPDTEMSLIEQAEVFETRANELIEYYNSLPVGVISESYAEAMNLRRKAKELRETEKGRKKK